MTSTVLHLRSETKPLERRSALTPSTTKALLEAGYTVNVERSSERIFDDEEFEGVGATLVPEGSWVNTPKDHIIVGLKELPASDDFPLHHAHIQFGHCYKQQANWAPYLSRFARGGGTLYDIEFLTDPSGKRVAAFGYYAGYAGAAIALLAWAHQLAHPETPLPAIPKYPSQSAVVHSVKIALSSAISSHHAEPPRALIVGVLGRCGRGAVDLCTAAGIPDSSIVKWDMAETARGGPFPEIPEADIFINCVYLAGTPTPPFVTLESLSKSGRELRVACDVSCDPTDPHNPVPIYQEISTFPKPTVPVKVDGEGPPLTMVSIDHLPSLVAREASNAFSELLLPSLKVLDRRNEEGVWVRAEELFNDMVAKLPVEK